MTRRSQHYPPELRERAVRMVAEVTPNFDSQWAAIGAVAQKLGAGTAETVRKRVRQAEADAGQRPGTTTEESAELRRLRRENAELRRANGILKSAASFLRQCHDDHRPEGFAHFFAARQWLWLLGDVRPRRALGPSGARGLIGACARPY